MFVGEMNIWREHEKEKKKKKKTKKQKNKKHSNARANALKTWIIRLLVYRHYSVYHKILRGVR